ncbi:unnamed protein product [Penicillium salamii]|nr:unnamed protein product [Penicillium salamii]
MFFFWLRFTIRSEAMGYATSRCIHYFASRPNFHRRGCAPISPISRSKRSKGRPDRMWEMCLIDIPIACVVEEAGPSNHRFQARSAISLATSPPPPPPPPPPLFLYFYASIKPTNIV